MTLDDVLFIILPIIAFLVFILFAFVGFFTDYFFIGIIVGIALLIGLILRRLMFCFYKTRMDYFEEHLNCCLIVLTITFILSFLLLKFFALEATSLIMSIYF